MSFALGPFNASRRSQLGFDPRDWHCKAFVRSQRQSVWIIFSAGYLAKARQA
jgi:hypothetical protein